MHGDKAYEVTDRLDDSAPRVLRRVFVIAVVLVFVIGFRLGDITTVIGVLIGVLALAVELLLPRERQLARYQELMVGRSTQAESAFGAVYEGLRERAVPGEVRPHRVRTGGGIRNVLTIRLGAYRAVLSVSEFGSGLLLGWTLTQRQLPVQAVMHWLATSLGAEPARDEPVWSLAEAVHGAVRQAAGAVEGGRQVALAEAFGFDVPIEDRDSPAPPPPRPAPAPAPAGVNQPAGQPEPPPYEQPSYDQANYEQQPNFGPHAFAPPPGAAGGGQPSGGPVSAFAPDGPGIVPGMDDEEDRTALIPPPPRFAPFEFTVGLPVEVYTPEGAVVGRLEPGTRYWAVDEHPSGLVVQIAAGAALLRDRGALRRD